jgi:hypothetical protein
LRPLLVGLCVADESRAVRRLTGLSFRKTRLLFHTNRPDVLTRPQAYQEARKRSFAR